MPVDTNRIQDFKVELGRLGADSIIVLVLYAVGIAGLFVVRS